MPRWDDPSIIGQPDQTPDPPPPNWSGWRPEPETPRAQVRVLVNNQTAGMAASARRHPAFQHLPPEQRNAAIDQLLGNRHMPELPPHSVSDLRRRIPPGFGR